MDGAPVLRSRLVAREAGEVGDFRKRQVDLGAAAGVVEMPDRIGELAGQFLWIHQPEECDIGVDAGDHLLRPVLGAIGQRHADRPAALDEYPGDRRIALDLGALFLRRRGDRVGEPAHAAADVAPHPADAVTLAHDVVEQHIRCAGIEGVGEGADNGVGGDGGRLELLRFEPAIQDRAGRPGENFDRLLAVGPSFRNCSAQS